MKDFPVCKEARSDCACFVNGTCRGLVDTSFKRPCPFHKTKEQAREDERIIRMRRSRKA